MKKLLSLLLAIALVFSAGSLVFADGGLTVSDGDGGDMQTVLIAPNPMVIAPNPMVIAPNPMANKDITIICTNDVHCNYLDYDKVATLAKDADLLIDAGDAIQGDVIGTLSKGEYIIDIMNYLGYDLAIPGNHEFDFTIPRLLELSKKANFDYISSNFSKVNGSLVFDAYKIFEINGKKIAFVGITTPDTFTASTPVFFQDGHGNYIYSFKEGADDSNLVKAVQAAIDAAKKEGADFVIGVGHMGMGKDLLPWTADGLISKTSGFDAFIDGHSHTTYIENFKNKDGKLVPTIQTGTKLEYCGKMVIGSNGKITLENIKIANIAADEDATAFIATVTERFDALQNKVVARTSVELTTKDENGNRAVRNHETNLGDLCADAYKIQMGADLAFINGGGVRADIAKGDITYGNIISVNPFGNSICLAEVTGQQILDALEFAYSQLPNENGGFQQVSGLTCTINVAVPSHVVVNEKGEFVKVNGQRRVSDVKINGEPIATDKLYKLAGHDYMLKNHGDGFTMFGVDKINLLKDCVMIDNQVLINYIVDDLGGTVGSQYAKARTSLNIIDDASLIEPEATTTYTVVNGDCLWKIAKKVYGDSSKWQIIYNANKSIIKNPNLIYVNQELEIPAA